MTENEGSGLTTIKESREQLFPEEGKEDSRLGRNISNANPSARSVVNESGPIKGILRTPKTIPRPPVMAQPRQRVRTRNKDDLKNQSEGIQVDHFNPDEQGNLPIIQQVNFPQHSQAGKIPLMLQAHRFRVAIILTVSLVVFIGVTASIVLSSSNKSKINSESRAHTGQQRYGSNSSPQILAENFPLGSGVPPPNNIEINQSSVWDSYLSITDHQRGRKIKSDWGEKVHHLWSQITNDNRESVDNVVPVFWNVPRSGGFTVMQIMGECAGLVQTGNTAVASSHIDDLVSSVKEIIIFRQYFFQNSFIFRLYLKIIPQKIEVIETEVGSYVNVDTTTQQGIEQAGNMGLLSSSSFDSISTPLLYELSRLFQYDEFKIGKIFTFLREPISRVVSFHQYMKDATWEKNYDPSIAAMTIETYANIGEDRPEFNWMTKNLVNKADTTNSLTLDDLHLAKEVMRSKILIGLMEQKDDSLKRFEKNFDWDFTSNDSEQCISLKKSWDSYNDEHAEQGLNPGTPIYDSLKKSNIYDVDLYEYAKQLFVDQRSLFE